MDKFSLPTGMEYNSTQSKYCLGTTHNNECFKEKLKDYFSFLKMLHFHLDIVLYKKMKMSYKELIILLSK